MDICGTFLNCTESIGLIVGSATTSTTGSLFMTLFVILILIMAVAFMFGIRMEYTAILVFPLLLGYLAYYGNFYAIGGVILIYLAIILTKNFLFK